jgi:hypothetical protein
VRLEVGGEPGDALDVEVVGRLVEHEQVPLLHEQRRERHAAALAAGHRADDAVEADAVQPEAVEHLAHRGVAGPGVLGRLAQDRLVGGEPDVDPRRPG